MSPFPYMFAMIIILLMVPLVKSLVIKDHNEILYSAKTAVKYAFFLSVTLALLTWFHDTKFTLDLMPWLITETLQIPITLNLDQAALLFMPTAFYVTWWILDYSQWYMQEDPALPKFIKHLLLFLIAMIVLVTADNMFQLFIGWEGVGIMSFLLIGWWRGRQEANMASMQAVLYNRVGDVGLLLAMTWFLSYLNTWDITTLSCLYEYTDSELPLLGLIVAAMGKSAQFGLHPWLPSAMEGPTPVSALLHSSTMVVAGIFLLIRFSPLMMYQPDALTACLYVGALTTFFSAACAAAQNDMKKIVAFSTASQLGLMMVAIGISAPQLALYHICYHAFFKSMLFMCVGIVSHALNGEQDIRKMGGLFNLLPITTSCLILGCFSLMGAPFLSAFYSKDFIIETMNASSLNSYALALTLIGTCMTAVYCCRLITLVLLAEPRYSPLPFMSVEDKINAKPLIQLALATIYMGSILARLAPIHSSPYLTFPLFTKFSIIIITLLGMVISLTMLDVAKNQPQNPSTRKPVNYTNMEAYYRATVHRPASTLKLVFGELLGSLSIDNAWLQRFGLAGVHMVLTSFFKNTKRVYKATMVVVVLLILLFMFMYGTYCLLHFTNWPPTISPRYL
uniref:NADH-ubiquinone oxidoreductase chain 5 n=1 Tax=Salminus brasiliensis TaxID=930266 RepID=A0A1X9WD42_SALBR|nr:NADH dehydrogenase subunit 5 [Salminus brasiliensis]